MITRSVKRAQYSSVRFPNAGLLYEYHQCKVMGSRLAGILYYLMENYQKGVYEFCKYEANCHFNSSMAYQKAVKLRKCLVT